MRLATWFLLASGALTACGGDEQRPARWSAIWPAIVQPNCATSSCHSEGAAVAGLNFATAAAGYRSLLDLHSVAQGRQTAPERSLVSPGNPTQSRVVNMLRAAGARRMPPDRPLAEADIVLIETWILNGAQND